MANEEKLTPMMQQYRAAKADIPADAILLFRLGDFYEMFFDDATRASAILDIVLTRRQGLPMCGFPYHNLDAQLPKLLAAGVKVAIAEQLEDPKLAKGIVKRAITRIITPGTVTEGSVLQPGRNNFLIALTRKKELFALASLDISTGEFKVTEPGSVSALETEINRLGARECVVPESMMPELENDPPLFRTQNKILFTPLPDYCFSFSSAQEFLTRHFGVAALDGFGCRGHEPAVAAAGAVLQYAVDNLRQEAGHVVKLNLYRTDTVMELDAASQRNLELVEPMYGSDKSATLFAILDKTVTPMGSRLLREFILRPLCDRDAILERLDAVESLIDDPLTMSEIHETLGVVRDLERIVARLNLGSASPRDMLMLATSLDTADGGVIRPGYNKLLDELRSAATEGKGWLADIQTREQNRTGIKSLKVRYNSVFGYYIEVSKANLDMVPEDYIRKQTLVNAERFITPELKELESKILGAEEKAKALEIQLFQQLREESLPPYST